MEKSNNQGRKGQNGQPSKYEKAFMRQVVANFQ